MKKALFGLLIAFAFVACKNEKEVETVEEVEVEVTTDETAAVKSYLWWQGGKAFVNDKHSGNMDITKTSFTYEDGKLVGGEIVADLTTMTSEDLEGEMAQKLLGHLMADDFFNVEQYPTATFKITEVTPTDDGMHNLKGEMTIRDVTKEITVPAKVEMTEDGKVTSLESEFSFDRSEYGVNFGSSKKFLDLAKDNIIKDEIDLKVMIKS